MNEIPTLYIAFPSTLHEPSLLVEEDGSLQRLEPMELDVNISPLNWSPLSSSSSTNKNIPDHLDPKVWGGGSMHTVKRKQTRESTSTDNRHQHQKNKENGVQDSTPYSYPTLLPSNGKQPMETPLEKNFHSNKPDDDSFRKENKNSFSETLLQACHLEGLKESPGMKMNPGIDGIARESSSCATGHAPLKSIKQLYDEISMKTSRRRLAKHLANYINQKLSYEEGSARKHWNQFGNQIFTSSVNIADEIISHQHFDSLSYDILNSLHLTEPESNLNHIKVFGSPKRYMRRLTKCEAPSVSWASQGPVQLVQPKWYLVPAFLYSPSW
jgi:hypothetical protein